MQDKNPQNFGSLTVILQETWSELRPCFVSCYSLLGKQLPSGPKHSFTRNHSRETSGDSCVYNYSENERICAFVFREKGLAMRVRWNVWTGGAATKLHCFKILTDLSQRFLSPATAIVMMLWCILDTRAECGAVFWEVSPFWGFRLKLKRRRVLFCFSLYFVVSARGARDSENKGDLWKDSCLLCSEPEGHVLRFASCGQIDIEAH